MKPAPPKKLSFKVWDKNILCIYYVSYTLHVHLTLRKNDLLWWSTAGNPLNQQAEESSSVACRPVIILHILF